MAIYTSCVIAQDSMKGMEEVVLRYFTGLFKANDVNYIHMQSVVELVQPKVTAEMNADLCAPYSAAEIKAALFQMYPTKAPGPDGMPPLFFQKYWEIVGSDVVSAVQHFLHTGQFLGEINYTHIFLIPKVKDPISLDMSKAYDRMEWSFLEAVLYRLGFDENWIGRSYHEMCHYCEGIKICEGAPVIHHLLFANDSLLFGKATLSECQHIQSVLNAYELASGQQINFAKSSIVFSKRVPEANKLSLASFLGVAIEVKHEKYLGLPTYLGRN
ncbi:uncharacterized protein LOC112171461 [Rosa chinensis]|uniref:uncharacterized protein LOC112171461 n=1 Tax=Rosa chinensis TaxID=74649 RepID=UPI000D092F38|nr:uncharacterized protein LOC112171461 [Rosa chinensis]